MLTDDPALNLSLQDEVVDVRPGESVVLVEEFYLSDGPPLFKFIHGRRQQRDHTPVRGLGTLNL